MPRRMTLEMEIKVPLFGSRWLDNSIGMRYSKTFWGHENNNNGRFSD